MEKTCRTCAALALYCDVTGVDLIGLRPIDCEYWSKCETPLLVDVLGQALKELLAEDTLRELVQQTKNWPNEPILNLISDVAPRALPALDRYQKEIGSGKQEG